jgi:hypothetical protein
MDKLEFCLSETKEALKNLKVIDKNANILLKFCKDYHKDALHYKETGDRESALGCAEYAHGFIDAGVLLGLIEIPEYHLKKEVE